MNNHLRIGPVMIRLWHGKYEADWGFPRIRINGLSLWSRDSGGDRILASYHPRGCPTWHWSVTISRNPKHRGFRRVRLLRPEKRTGQWHDYYRLPFGFTLIIGRQDYHKRSVS